MDFKVEYEDSQDAQDFAPLVVDHNHGEQVEVPHHGTQVDEIMETLSILKTLLYGLNDRMANLEEILLSRQQGPRPRPSDDDLQGQPPPKKPVKSRLGIKGRLGKLPQK